MLVRWYAEEKYFGHISSVYQSAIQQKRTADIRVDDLTEEIF
jgi:hypothetical protein